MYDSANAIIMNFPAFAGGKFITNCLSLSSDAIPQDRQLAEYVLKNPDDVEFKLKTILNSIPDKTRMREWRRYCEFHEMDIYGKKVYHQWFYGRKPELSDLHKQIIQARKLFFVTSHGFPESLMITVLKSWDNAKVVKLYNYSEFMNIALNLKGNTFDTSDVGIYSEEGYNNIKGMDWPEWETFNSLAYDLTGTDWSSEIIDEIHSFYHWAQIEAPVINFDIGSIFVRSEFFNNMNKLYNELGLDDFNEDLIQLYYNAYITAHNIKG